nr:hypothetical protein L203_03513 [Cryptococcus depauperatus CBS 7841]
MDTPTASTSRNPTLTAVSGQLNGEYANLSFKPASQAQILRSHQRDVAQISRLKELVAEILRSLAGGSVFLVCDLVFNEIVIGTRWITHKQTLIDVLVKAVYLTLTLGRGQQTLGEEYTDILPFFRRSHSLPSKWRRLFTIVFLLLPTLLASPEAARLVRHESTRDHAALPTRWTRYQEACAKILESPCVQALPELHMIAFLFRGRFFELGRRLAGLSYVSLLPPKPIDQRPASYEPLGLFLLIRFLARIFAQRQNSDVGNQESLSRPPIMRLQDSQKVAPNVSNNLSQPKETILVTSPMSFDSSNTYLTPEAIELPERQCTLCLESRGTGEGSGGTVAVTECGHIFCWGCLGGLEKASLSSTIQCSN